MSDERAEREVEIVNAAGLHARPAAEFVKLAGRFTSRITEFLFIVIHSHSLQKLTPKNPMTKTTAYRMRSFVSVDPKKLIAERLPTNPAAHGSLSRSAPRSEDADRGAISD